jgi:hypothetical protein
LRDLLAVVFRQRRLALFSFVAVFFAVVLYGLIAPPDQSEMKVLVRRGGVDPVVTPGAIVPLRTHRCGGAAYLISWSDFIRRDQDGNVLADSRNLSPPQTVPWVQWTDPLPPHSVENVGGSVLSILMVELKSTRVVGQSAVPENAGRRG